MWLYINKINTNFKQLENLIKIIDINLNDKDYKIDMFENEINELKQSNKTLNDIFNFNNI